MHQFYKLPLPAHKHPSDYMLQHYVAFLIKVEMTEVALVTTFYNLAASIKIQRL